jgi:hypothetical protein
VRTKEEEIEAKFDAGWRRWAGDVKGGGGRGAERTLRGEESERG